MGHIKVGDLLEAGLANGKIVFPPKSLMDRHVAEGLGDVRRGRTHGPYGSPNDAISALERRAKRHAKK
jgi:hypothetical protein